MAQLNYSELAGSEDARKFEVFLVQELTPKGITPKVAVENGYLYILLEAAQAPERQKTLTSILSGISILKDFPGHSLRIYGRRTGDTFAEWIDELNRNREQNWSLNSSDRLFSDASFSNLNDSSIGSVDHFSDKESEGALPATQRLQEVKVERFLVCGLGKLGQHCVMALTTFATADSVVKVTAIDRNPPEDWEIDQLPNLLAGSVIKGDCRQDRILVQAGIQACRTILIVTSDENVNIETAIAARRLNPNIRLLVRSGKHNLNELLKQRLGNFAAFDPIELPAKSFALAALGEETIGLFKLGDRQLQVVKYQVQPGAYRFEDLPIYKLHKESCRLLYYLPKTGSEFLEAASPETLKPKAEASRPESLATQLHEKPFYQWQSDARIKPGDTLIYIEETEQYQTSRRQIATNNWQRFWQQLKDIKQGNWQQGLAQLRLWVSQDRTHKISVIGLSVAFILGAASAVLLKLNVPDMSWQAAISSAVILLLGGYGDVFGGLETVAQLPWWLQFFCFLVTAISLLFILSVLGLLADRLLSSRFDFLRRRPPVPSKNHIVLIGLGRVGQQIAAQLYSFSQPFVCLTHEKEQQDFMPQVPLVCSPILRGLTTVNLAQAKSLILATDEQMLNLEIALMARDAASKVNRTLNLVIRAQNQRFSDHLNGLLPDAKALCVYALAAEAFAGAAFGESILGLFRLFNQTILVTEYYVEKSDTLNSKLLAQVAYGYEVVPIFYQSGADGSCRMMPSDDIRLQVGDRLVVLATINGLQRIEWGTLTQPLQWKLQALKPLNPGAIYYAGNVLENVTGCELSDARAFMNNLPGVLGIPGEIELSLYRHQAFRLFRKLRKLLPINLTAVNGESFDNWH